MVYKETAVSLTEAKPCPIPNVGFAPGADSPPWYAAYTLPRHEKAVAEHLAFRQVETYLPLYLSARLFADLKGQARSAEVGRT